MPRKLTIWIAKMTADNDPEAFLKSFKGSARVTG